LRKDHLGEGEGLLRLEEEAVVLRRVEEGELHLEVVVVVDRSPILL
jgi:hypothetical protein